MTFIVVVEDKSQKCMFKSRLENTELENTMTGAFIIAGDCWLKLISYKSRVYDTSTIFLCFTDTDTKIQLLYHNK